MLRIFKFTVTGKCNTPMGPNVSVDDHYIIADTYEQAKAHVENNYKVSGWEIQKMVCNNVFATDIRNQN